MNKMLQNFGQYFVSIICNILFVICQEFVIFTEYTVPSLSPCCGLLTALVLLNSVAR